MHTAQVIALTRLRMLFFQTYLLFSNYPNNLGIEILKAVEKYKHKVVKDVKGIFQNFSDPNFIFSFEKSESKIEKKTFSREEQIGRIFGMPIELFKATQEKMEDSFTNQVYKTNPFDFEWSLLTKELVTLISFLDAYIANSIRVVCRIKLDLIDGILEID